MVCKEDVITWFKEAASYRRIDVMCSLLNMCVPFELRYLGTCIEEQGKHDHQELRGAALTANSIEKLTKEFANSKGLFEKCTRHRLTVFVSLLQSRNNICANWMYNAMLRTDSLETYLNSNSFKKDVNLHTELLLLFTMAINHPAFTFEQKRYFGEIVTRLTEPEVLVQPAHTVPPYPPGLGYNIKPPMQIHHMPVGVPKPPGPSLPHTEAPLPPPGIPLPPMHNDFVTAQTMWPRTPFINATCPPPDLAAFPPPISPLVSQHSSPTPSRSVSPTRMYPCRPHPPPIPPIVQHMDRLPPPVKDPLVLPTPHYNTDLKSVPIEEVHGDSNDKNPQHQWLEPGIVMSSKIANGLLPGMPVPPKCQTMFLRNEMQALSLDAETSLRCASSSSSSSDGQSPPDTPTENTIPKASNEVFTVPYTSPYAPPPAAFHNRLFYTQTYRPQFPAYQQNGELPYMFSYVPIMNFSAPIPKVTCYNCGLTGHEGSDCKEPTIEEITQKVGYQLDYTSPPPDSQPPSDKQ